MSDQLMLTISSHFATFNTYQKLIKLSWTAVCYKYVKITACGSSSQIQEFNIVLKQVDFNVCYRHLKHNKGQLQNGWLWK